MKSRISIRWVIALLPILVLCSCSTAPTDTSAPTASVSPSSGPDDRQEDAFVPDYAPGEAVTHSMYYDALAAQQGNWLYYGIKKGKGGWGRDIIVKTPLGKTAEDRVVLLTQKDLQGDFNLSCRRCGQDTTTYGDIKGILGTLGDWVYMQVDKHILRLRTDGKIMESVLCLEPDDRTKNTVLMIRDNMLYYLSEEHRPVSASQTEDTWTIRKLDLSGGETRDVGAVPVSVEMAGWCGNDVILRDYKFLDHYNAYVLGADDSLTLCEKWEFTYGKDSPASFRILQGCTGEDMLVSGELISMQLRGIYRMNRKDLESFAKKSYYIPKSGDRQTENGIMPVYDISPFSAFLLPGTDDCYPKSSCNTDGGFCFSESDGLYYYSDTDKAVRKLNGDEADHLLWPGDGYLYYVCTTKDGSGYYNGVYRIRQDGTGWEDVSWMVAPVNG